MKSILFCLTIAFSTIAQSQSCPPQLRLSEHMRELSHLFDTIYAGYNDPLRIQEMEKTAQLMRQHLAAVLVETPSKIKGAPEPMLGMAKLEFQEYITNVITLSLRLERAFRLEPSNDEQKMKRQKIIRETLEGMNQTIGMGHEKFRNRK